MKMEENPKMKNQAEVLSDEEVFAEGTDFDFDESKGVSAEEKSPLTFENVTFNIPRKWRPEFAKNRSLYLCCKRRLFWYLPVSLHTSKWGAIHAAAECDGVVFIQKYGRDLKRLKKDVRIRKYTKRNHCRKEA